MVEALEDHIEKGLSPRDAAFKAMEEVSGPVVAIALILSAVFIPTAFIPGITGRMYQQFAVTIAISVPLLVLVAVLHQRSSPVGWQPVSPTYARAAHLNCEWHGQSSLCRYRFHRGSGQRNR